jgi:hypothetical protein
MAVVKIYPYLLPSAERIEVVDWRQKVDNEDHSLPFLLFALGSRHVIAFYGDCSY